MSKNSVYCFLRGQMLAGHTDPDPKDLVEISGSEVVLVIIGSVYVFLSMRSFLFMAWFPCCCPGSVATVLNGTQWTFFYVPQYLCSFSGPSSASLQSHLLWHSTLTQYSLGHDCAGLLISSAEHSPSSSVWLPSTTA